MIFGFLLFLHSISSASEPICLDGYYDLGQQAASLGFTCDSADPSTARIFFCQRKALLQDGICTGAGFQIRCLWTNGAVPQQLPVSPQGSFWRCDEGGNYPFTAVIQQIDSESISYVFKSSFNSGSLVGTLISGMENPSRAPTPTP